MTSEVSQRGTATLTSGRPAGLPNEAAVEVDELSARAYGAAYAEFILSGSLEFSLQAALPHLTDKDVPHVAAEALRAAADAWEDLRRDPVHVTAETFLRGIAAWYDMGCPASSADRLDREQR